MSGDFSVCIGFSSCKAVSGLLGDLLSELQLSWSHFLWHFQFRRAHELRTRAAGEEPHRELQRCSAVKPKVLSKPPTFWSVAYLVIPGTYDESLVINLVPYQPTSAMECHRVLDVTRTSLWVMGSISMIWRGTAWLRFHFSSTRALGSSAMKVLGGNCFRTLHGSRGQIRLELPKGSMEGSTKVAPRLY